MISKSKFDKQVRNECANYNGSKKCIWCMEDNCKLVDKGERCAYFETCVFPILTSEGKDYYLVKIKKDET